MKAIGRVGAAVAIAAALIAASNRPAAAEELGSPGAKSIYEIDPLIDGLVIGVTTFGAAIPFAFKNRIVEPRCPCDRDEVNAFDRVAVGRESQALRRLGDFTVAMTIVGPLTLNALVLRDWDIWLEDAVVFTEVVATNLALVNAVKLAVQRPYPKAYDSIDPDQLTIARSYMSFYSGHTSVAFAALSATAVTVGWRYGHWVVPCVAGAAVASSVGVEMVLSGGHFPTDVIAGAIAGVAVGTVIPWLHLRERSLQVQPWSPPGGVGLALRGRM